MLTVVFWLVVLESALILAVLGVIAYLRLSPRRPPELLADLVGEPEGKYCHVCRVRLPETAIRTHHGRWRCAAHKDVP